MPKNKTKMRGLTTVEGLLIAAAFIIVGVIGLLTFQNMGKSAAESLRANAIVTADRGRLRRHRGGAQRAAELRAPALRRVWPKLSASLGYCIMPNGAFNKDVKSNNIQTRQW
jgi:Tfp pilus assembly protein PilV